MSFISFLGDCEWPRLPVLCQIVVARVGICVCFRRKALSFLPLNMKLTVGFAYMTFILRCVSSILNLLRFLSWKDVIFFKCFFCVHWDGHMIFIIQFVNMVYHIYWFVYIEPFLFFLHPRNKSHLITRKYSFLIHCWIQFANILLRSLAFTKVFIRDIDLWFSCWYQGNTHFVKCVCVWKYSLLFSFWEAFEKDWH